MLQNVIAGIIVAAALVYLIRHYVKKFRRLAGAKIGPCGHCCDNCPFAKTSQCCHHKNADNGSGCGCGR